jgi:hypothetical protein
MVHVFEEYAVSTFGVKESSHSSTFTANMEAAGSTKMLVQFIKLHGITSQKTVSNLHIHCHENLNSHTQTPSSLVCFEEK